MKDIDIENDISIYATPCNYKDNIFDMNYVHYKILSRKLRMYEQTALLQSDDGVKVKLRSFHFTKTYYCNDPAPHSVYDIVQGWTQWELKECGFGHKWHKVYLFNNYKDTADFLIETYESYKSDVEDRIKLLENRRKRLK